MGFTLSSGVSGLQAHQKMLDVAGNNLANINTPAFKSSRIAFSELLSETIKKASQPTPGTGGTNPQQMGSGVGVSSITPNMSQGNIVNTGNPLDMAIEGDGYFVVSDGEQSLYTRAGAFAVDADSNLIDPATGYRAQRIGNTGVRDGFQTGGVSDIHIPYDVTMEAKATASISIQGNLSADATLDTAQTQMLTSNIAYTISSGAMADEDTLISELAEFSGTFTAATLTVSGSEHNGDDLSDTGLTVTATTDMGAVIDHLKTILGSSNATASLVNGQIRITDVDSGYSKSDVELVYSDSSSTLTVPAYFELTSVGGEEVKDINITTYDSLGGKNVLSGSFVRTGTANTWDMVLTSITGDIHEITMANRRIEGISFDATNGSYAGITGSDAAEFVVKFGHDEKAQTIAISLGTEGKYDGVTQLAGTSTAVARDQDGYTAGRLSTVSVDEEGTVVGAFSNGVKKDIAIIQIALFLNPAALENVGNGYFAPSANSGEAVATQAVTGRAGSIHGGAVEKSNVDVATEFVSMIQAQNGFQANARTIRVANDILRELSNLIR